MAGLVDWYRTGTVEVTNGAPLVVGTGTNWTDVEIRSGDVFLTDGTHIYEILALDVATQTITLAGNWAGASSSGLSYAVIRNFAAQPGADLVVEQIDIIRQLRTYLEQHYDWQTAPAAGSGNPPTTVTFTNWNGTTYEFESLPQLIAGLTTTVNWGALTGVPATFPPEAHTHPEITSGLGSVASQSASNVNLTGGSIDGVSVTNSSIDDSPIGGSTPSTGVFSVLSALSLKIKNALGLISTDTTIGSDTKQITLIGGGAENRGGSVTVYGDQAGVRAGGVDVKASLDKNIELQTSGIGKVITPNAIQTARGVKVISTHPTDSETALFDRSELTTDDSVVRIKSGNQGKTIIQFEDEDSSTVGAIGYDHALNRIFLKANEQTVAVIDVTGMEVLVPFTATQIDLSSVNVTSGTINGTVIGQTTPAAGYFTTIYGDHSGNSTTATTLQVGRTISLTGKASGSVSFNGSSDVSLNVNLLSVAASDISSGQVAVARGGTGLSSYVTGDLLAASGSDTLSALAAGAVGYSLVSNGPGILPSYQKVDINNGTLGNLATSKLNGGLGASISTFWRGDGTWAPVSVNIANISGMNLSGAAAGSYLRNDGTAWLADTIKAGDVPALDASKIASGTFPAARLGSGTANSSTVLFGDGVYRSPASTTATWGTITGTISSQADLVAYIGAYSFNAAQIGSGTINPARIASGATTTGYVPILQSNGTLAFGPQFSGITDVYWGDILGTLSSQTDLMAALNDKASLTHTHNDATPSLSGFMSDLDKTKLDGIQSGATANSTDSALRDRSSHTGTQSIATIQGLQAELLSRVQVESLATDISDGIGSSFPYLELYVKDGRIGSSTYDQATLIPASITLLGMNQYTFVNCTNDQTYMFWDAPTQRPKTHSDGPKMTTPPDALGGRRFQLPKEYRIGSPNVKVNYTSSSIPGVASEQDISKTIYGDINSFPNWAAAQSLNVSLNGSTKYATFSIALSNGESSTNLRFASFYFDNYGAVNVTVNDGSGYVTHTLTKNTDFKTINGNSIIGSGDLVVGGGGSGTVTSVNASVTGTGLSVTGGPIVNSGTLAFTLSSNLQSWSGLAPSAKQDTLVSGTSIKTVNGTSLLGSGNIAVSASPVGSADSIQYNSGGYFDGATKASISDGYLNVGSFINPPVYAKSGHLALAHTNDAQQSIVGVSPQGDLRIYGGDALRSLEFGWRPLGNGTTITSINATAITAVGTATTATIASGSALTYANRIEYLTTTAATNAISSIRHAVAQLMHGYTLQYGGYRMSMYFGIATGTSNATRRAFFGVQASTSAPTDVNPSTLLNTVGVGYDSSDTNWYVITNNNSGAATKLDTGMARPTSDRQTLYRLDIVVNRQSSYAVVSLTDVVTGATSTLYPTDIPAATTMMNLNSYVSAGGTSAVTGIIFGGAFFEKNLSYYQ